MQICQPNLVSPPPLVRTTVKTLEMTETTPQAVLHTPRRHKQGYYLSAQFMYNDLHAWTLTRVANRGRTVFRSLKIQSPAPNDGKKLVLHGPPENGTVKCRGPKSCRHNASCCSDKGMVLAGAAGAATGHAWTATLLQLYLPRGFHCTAVQFQTGCAMLCCMIVPASLPSLNRARVGC